MRKKDYIDKMRDFNLALCFDDVSIQSEYSEIMSRSSDELDLSVKIKDIEIKLPLISSPMDKVYSKDMTKTLSDYGAISLIHRYNSIYEQVSEYERYKGYPNLYSVGCAIGVGEDSKERFNSLYESGCKVFCIDVAHAHHILAKQLLEHINKNYETEELLLIAGNVSTFEGYKDLVEWGTDIVRVGQGGGSSCVTSVKTGIGQPLFQTILDCKTAKDMYGGVLLADGGIGNFGHICKSFAGGADMVMVGRMLAATSDSPSEIVPMKDGRQGKLYRGMASPDAQKDWRGSYKSNEGVSGIIPYTGQTTEFLDEFILQTKTLLSYCGCKDIKTLQDVAKWRRVTSASVRENNHRLEI